MGKFFMETDFVLHILLQKIDSSVGILCISIMFSLNGFWSMYLQYVVLYTYITWTHREELFI